jgi:penicillin-insensitive murein endopeptidase
MNGSMRSNVSTSMRSVRSSLSQARRGLGLLGVVAAVLVTSTPIEAKPSRSLPARYAKAPYSKMSLSVGHPNAGYQLRAKKLKKGPGLEILAKSHDRVYGHPSLVLMLQRSAKQMARSYPGSVLVVGDLSLPEGGPLVGHASHQSGRDADVLFYVRDAKGRLAKDTRFTKFGADGKATDGSGLVFDDERNWQLVQAWARDHRAGLAYVFVSRPLRARLLAWGSKHATKDDVTAVQALFVQPDDSEPHDDHFHVRIRCPKDQDDVCKEQSR